jgi:hypothetical protein
VDILVAPALVFIIIIITTAAYLNCISLATPISARSWNRMHIITVFSLSGSRFSGTHPMPPADRKILKELTYVLVSPAFSFQPFLYGLNNRDSTRLAVLEKTIDLHGQCSGQSSRTRRTCPWGSIPKFWYLVLRTERGAAVLSSYPAGTPHNPLIQMLMTLSR